MERHDMLLKLKALKLYGMAAAFDEVIDEGVKRSRTPFDVLGRLLAAEDSERHARSIRYQMAVAKFPEFRELATFDFSESGATSGDFCGRPPRRDPTARATSPCSNEQPVPAGAGARAASRVV